MSGNINVQCINTGLSISLAFISIESDVDGACIDFETGEVYCYESESAGVSVGVGFDIRTSLFMSVSCPKSTEQISGKTEITCAPYLSILGMSFFPIL